MKKPLLQIALDNLTIEDAIKSAKAVEKYIDILEVGTILIASEGKKSISALKKAFPTKIICADGKIADAGNIFAKMFFDEGADLTTAICAAETPTVKSIVEESKKYKNKEVQIELTSHFTWDQAQEWKDVGATHAVWHRSRDSQAAGVNWSQNDIDSIKRLIKIGFKITLTGGITVKDIAFFKGLPIEIFIGGRALRDAPNPELAAKEFKDEIAKYW
ncbi:MAG: 3-keto-L-gulonate-6-phosphate decarboxylase UlaD [Mycoplasmataceae bacterium]|nr:3-keto-L-gulonate-6-phosphate decarboxylase UlaD [Mycoplasmataceae bacterium]